tara:strand:+ start:460 stop:663 length:204 start_codon:yes stop_codon:yes gene_type:complete
MAKLATLLALPIGLGLVKLAVDRTVDEPNSKDIVPKSTNGTTTVRPLIITDRPTEGAIERGKKGFGL